jgi:hypothetical protein
MEWCKGQGLVRSIEGPTSLLDAVVLRVESPPVLDDNAAYLRSRGIPVRQGNAVRALLQARVSTCDRPGRDDRVDERGGWIDNTADPPRGLAGQDPIVAPVRTG